MQLVAQTGERSAAALCLADFDYDLPPALIAQTPPPARDGGRLMVLDRHAAGITHGAVRDLPALLRRGDLLVLNDTRVRPARLFARSGSGAAVELLLLECDAAGAWDCLGKPAKRLRAGAALQLPDGGAAEVVAAPGNGRYTVRFAADCDVGALLATHGEIPLPPYIKRPDGALPLDTERYQTVFAAAPGAVAAPTAGLHFTREHLAALQGAGVELAWLTLHVGPGTFLPVREDDVGAHHMEPESASIPTATAAAVQRAKTEGRRVVAVGTTTTRALESAAQSGGAVAAGPLRAGAFITPGHRFRVVDALFTNFHLPKSTLLMLVSAFAGRERVLAAYAAAVQAGYRFYSYGDAMLIL